MLDVGVLVEVEGTEEEAGGVDFADDASEDGDSVDAAGVGEEAAGVLMLDVDFLESVA